MRLISRIILLTLSLACTAVLVLWVCGYRSAAVAGLRADQMQDQLARVIPYVSLKNMPLREAVWFLQDAGLTLGAGNDIELNAGAVRAAGVSPDVPLTVEDRNIPLGLAITRVSSAAGVACRADDEMIHISSAGDLRLPSSFERPARGHEPADARLTEALHRRISHGPVSLSQTTLGHALHKLEAASGVTIVVDPAALRSAGIDGNAPVNVTARQTTTANLLGLILRDAAPREPLQFRAEGDVVRVSTRRQFDREDRPRRVRLAGLIATGVITTIIVAFAGQRPIRRAAASLGNHSGFAAIAVGLAVVTALIASRPRPLEVVAFSRRLTVDSDRRELHVWLSLADPLSAYREHDAPKRARSLAPVTPVPITRVKSVPGFAIFHRGWPYDGWLVRTRCATAAALTGVLPLMWLGWSSHARLKLWSRRKGGQCLACGYDLRGSTGCCPECGADRGDAATLTGARV